MMPQQPKGNEPKYNFDWRVAMLGPSGSGKTSMLAAMYHEFERMIGDSPLTLTTIGETGNAMDEQLGLLQAAANGAKGTVVKPPYVGTRTRMQYAFKLNHFDCDTSLHLVFEDYPGEFMRYEKDTIEEIVRTSRVLLVAIDTPCLMELPQHAYTQRHGPNSLADMLINILPGRIRSQTAVQDDQEYLILFVAMKSEKWIQEGHGEEVLRKFRKTYGKLLRFLRGNTTIDAAFIPIQTLGSLVFERFDNPERVDDASYRKISDDVYTPADCEQPLRYALGHMFANLRETAQTRADARLKEIKERRKWDRFKFFFKEWAGKDQLRNERREWISRSESLLTESENFSRGKKDNPKIGFQFFDFTNPDMEYLDGYVTMKKRAKPLRPLT